MSVDTLEGVDYDRIVQNGPKKVIIISKKKKIGTSVSAVSIF